MKDPDIRYKGKGIEDGAKVSLSMNCLPREPLANLICHMSTSRQTHTLGFGPTIMSMLTSLLTLSMKTSLLYVSVTLFLMRYRVTYNSSRHLMGAPMAASNVSRQSKLRQSSDKCLPSHIESSRQIVEKDFSPPDKPFVSRPLARKALPSGSICYHFLA